MKKLIFNIILICLLFSCNPTNGYNIPENYKECARYKITWYDFSGHGSRSVYYTDKIIFNNVFIFFTNKEDGADYILSAPLTIIDRSNKNNCQGN